MKDYTRQDLMDICEKGVVHHTKWQNRDSYSAQVLLSDIYRALQAGYPYVIENIDVDYQGNPRTIWIKFEHSDEHRERLDEAHWLPISDRDEYFKDCDPERETEMFDGYGLNFFEEEPYLGGYLPTMERLLTLDGDDWY